MKNLFKLIKINILGIIRGDNSNDKKKKASGLIIYGILFGLLFFYSYKISKLAIKFANLIDVQNLLLPVFFSIISSFLLLTNYNKVNSTFFKCKDYDLLSSLPIKKRDIYISKVLDVYFMALFLTIAFMIPPYIVYINNIDVSFIYHLYFYITLFLIPIIPVLISIILGTIISYISSFFKKRDSINIIFTLTIFVVVYLITYNITGINPSKITSIGNIILDTFSKYYPVTRIYNNLINDLSLLHLVIYILINIIVMFITYIVIDKSYSYISNKNNVYYKSTNKKIKYTKKSSKVKRLLIKDYKRLFSSANYFLNTTIGSILMLMLAVYMIVAKDTSIAKTIGSNIDNLSINISIIGCALIGFTYPVAVSLSLEGKSFNNLKILPISFKDIYEEKLIFNYSLTIIPSIISLIAIYFKFAISTKYLLVFILLFSAYIFLYANVQLLIDLMFLKLNWSNEIKIIKQSPQSIIAIIIAITFSFIPLLTINFNITKLLILSLIVFTVGLITCIINNTYGKNKYLKSYY